VINGDADSVQYMMIVMRLLQLLLLLCTIHVNVVLTDLVLWRSPKFDPLQIKPPI